MLNIGEIPDDELIEDGVTKSVESVLIQSKPINPSFTSEPENEEVFKNESDEEQKTLYRSELNLLSEKQTNTPRPENSVEIQCYQHDIPLEMPNSTGHSISEKSSMSSDVIVSTIGIQVESQNFWSKPGEQSE